MDSRSRSGAEVFFVRSPVTRSFLLCAGILAILLVPHAMATITPAGTVLTPAAIPLTPLGHQAIDMKIAIIPSGSTTFSKEHSLQMQTGLASATWNIQVYEDGIAAAQQQATGDAAFVSGYLLSYGTNHDVSLEVTVAGTVPDTPGGQVTLLTVTELDNSGSPVPGSSITVTEPVAAPASSATPASAATPATTTPAAPATQKSGGLCAALAFLACAAAAFVVSRKNR